MIIFVRVNNFKRMNIYIRFSIYVDPCKSFTLRVNKYYLGTFFLLNIIYGL